MVPRVELALAISWMNLAAVDDQAVDETRLF